MPKVSRSVIEAELDEIEALVARYPQGVSREEIGRVYATEQGRRISPRTLQRRLEELVSSERVEATGESRAREYRPVAREPIGGDKRRRELQVPEGEDGRSTPATTEPYLPLSTVGRDVYEQIRRPIMYRHPVGYDRGFLERYNPGETWYLPHDTRERMHEVGRTPDPNRPAGTFARDILHRLLIDLSWSSSRLEGNTYDRLDTENLIEFGQRAEGKHLIEAQMILNHKAAIEFLVENAQQIAFSSTTIQHLHTLLSENLLPDPGDEGRLRERPVGITGTVYTPVAIPQVIEDCFRLLLEKAEAIPDPFEQSFFAMVHLPYLQPFADVNKRTSRLAANIPLIKANLCPLSFVDLPERAYVDGNLAVYELTRIELLRDVFTWSYERSCKRYRIVRDSVDQPDLIRLKYRDQIARVIHGVVAERHPPRKELLRSRAASEGIPKDDLDLVTDRALAILLGLHSGNAWRYDLRPSEFTRWKAQFSLGQ